MAGTPPHLEPGNVAAVAKADLQVVDLRMVVVVEDDNHVPALQVLLEAGYNHRRYYKLLVDSHFQIFPTEMVGLDSRSAEEEHCNIATDHHHNVTQEDYRWLSVLVTWHHSFLWHSLLSRYSHKRCDTVH